MTSLGGPYPTEQGRNTHQNAHQAVSSTSGNVKAFTSVTQDEYIDAEAIFSLRNIEARYPHLRFSIIEMGTLSFFSLSHLFPLQ